MASLELQNNTHEQFTLCSFSVEHTSSDNNCYSNNTKYKGYFKTKANVTSGTKKYNPIVIIMVFATNPNKHKSDTTLTASVLNQDANTCRSLKTTFIFIKNDKTYASLHFE